MTLERLFSSDEIEVTYLPGASDFLLLTFCAIDFDTKIDAFWGRHFAQKAGYAALGFVARRNNWYPRKDMMACRASIQHVLDRYQAKITYGSSMGGYGAVKYASFLGATSCAAFGPQVSISSADGVGSQAYTRYYDSKLHDGMLVGGGDLCQNAYIFYDPFEKFDSTNARHITSVAPHANLVLLPYAGHECIKIIAGAQNAQEILQFCVRGDTKNVVSTCRRLRSSSSARHAGLAGALLRKCPDLAFRIIDRYSDGFDKKQLAIFYDAAAAAYAAKGEFSNAEANSLKSLELMPNRESFLKTLGQIYERTNRYGEALVIYNQYLTVNPNDAVMHNAVAGLYLNTNEIERAALSAEKAFAILPSNANIVRRLSKIRVIQDRDAEALSLLEEGLRAAPGNAHIRHDYDELIARGR